MKNVITTKMLSAATDEKYGTKKIDFNLIMTSRKAEVLKRQQVRNKVQKEFLLPCYANPSTDDTD